MIRDLCVNNPELLVQLLAYAVTSGDEIQYYEKDRLLVRLQLMDAGL